MSLGGNFGKPLFGSQTSSAASFGSAASPFGGPSPFGGSQSAPSFGSSPNAFQGGAAFGGATPATATPQTGFGMPSGAAPNAATPSPFGQAQPAFGNTGMGINPGQPTFAQSSPSFFGSGSTFGNSQAAFASSSPFPASTFSQPSFAAGTSSIGGFGLGPVATQSAPPAFGSSSAAFGAKNLQTNIPFSNTAFGNTPSNLATGFGQGSLQGSTIKGTGNPKFQPVQEYDGGGVNVKYMSITRMPDYQDKSFEELRYEDYLLGKKNSTSLSTFQPAGSTFGAPSVNTGVGAPSSGFFGSSPSMSAPAFGASSSSLFGNTPAPAFGGASQPATVPAIGFGSSPFGQTSTGFGSNTSIFGGSSSVPAFGAQSGASFQTAATPFGLSSSSSGLFSSSNAGQKPFSGFGSSMPSQPMGSFGSSSFFGGGNTSAPAFGSTSAPSQPTLNLGSFGSSFGGNRFGPSTAGSSSSFGTSTFASSSPFGSSFAFGADSSKPSGSLFGGGLSASPQTAPTLFGSPPAASSGASLFSSFSSNPTAFSTIGQPQNAGGSSAAGLSFSNIGNSFSGLQSSSSGLFGATPNFSFSAPVAQQSASFSMGNTSLFATQNTLNNTQGPQQNWSFATPQNFAPRDNTTSTPYGKSPIFEAASLSWRRSSDSTNPVESNSSSNSLSFSSGSTSIARPSARSFARIHARSLRSSLALNSPMFEAKRSVSVFSPEHFSLVETKSNSSPLRSPSIARSDMKRLIITPRSDDEKLGTSREEKRNGVHELSSPEEKKLSFAPSSFHSSEAHTKSNGAIYSTEDRKSSEFPPPSRVTKPTPLRSPGQYSGNLKSPSVYNSYREFYEDNLSPETKSNSVPRVEERNSAPTLTKPNYYTVPSLDKLKKMRGEDLSHVYNFTVGRREVGEIQWLGETDVRNLDLDRLVHIENREVIVYPDEEEKPEIGVGLNKPAKVSLHKVWKVDKKTGQQLKDVSSVTNFTAKLKQHCEKQGLTFLGYDATQGTWSFEVPHFSRYGLPDSEDESSEEDDILESGISSTTNTAMNPVFDKEIERIHEDEVEDEFPTVEEMYIKESSGMDKSLESEKKQIDTNVVIPPRSGNKLSSNSSRTLSSSRKRSHIFSVDLFKTPEQRFFPSKQQQSYDEEYSPRIKLSSPMETDSEQLLSHSLDEKEPTTTKEDKQPVSKSLSRAFPPPAPSLYCQVSWKNSFLYKATEMKGDALLFLGRSFRASIGPGFQVAFPVFNNSSNSFCVDIYAQTQEWEQSFIQKTLQIHFSSWKLCLDEMNDSVGYKRPSFRLPFLHHEVVVETLSHLISEAGFSGNQHFELVLRLLLLFVHKVDQDSASSNEIFRRNLSSWLQNYACTWSQEEKNPTNDPFLHIFLLLSRGEVEQAVQFCNETKNFRLACMIAKGMQLQDEVYRSCCCKIHRHFCGHVSKDLDRIYSLLSGDILHATDNLSLSWYRTFGLHFWYGSHTTLSDYSSSNGLQHSLQSYIDQWQNNPNSVSPPVPPHIVISVPEHEQLEASKDLKSNNVIYDACYVLLCIAANLYPEHVQWMHLATPLAYGIYYDPLDAHKPWLVCEILSSIFATSYLDPKVVISFAVQLEMMHLYTWAFYILWSCDIFENNMFGLKSVFLEWFPWIVSEQVEGLDGMVSSDIFLRQQLGVPDSWFDEAASIYARYNFQYLEEAEHLCSLFDRKEEDDSLFSLSYIANRAHQVVASRAAPHVLILCDASDRISWTRLSEILHRLNAFEGEFPGLIHNYRNVGPILQEVISSIVQRKRIVSLESLWNKMEAFVSFVQPRNDSHRRLRNEDRIVDLFITFIFSYLFRETWEQQLLEEPDDSKMYRLFSCWETIQHIPNIPWSCKQFLDSFMETYRRCGISLARDLPTRQYASFMDLWFPLVK